MGFDAEDDEGGNIAVARGEKREDLRGDHGEEGLVVGAQKERTEGVEVDGGVDGAECLGGR